MADSIVPNMIAMAIPATAPGSSQRLYGLAVVVVVTVVVVNSLYRISTVLTPVNAGVPLSTAVIVMVYIVPYDNVPDGDEIR